MNKRFMGILYLFIITTLFLFITPANVFALTIDEMIKSNYQIYTYESRARTKDGKMPLSSYDAIKLPLKKSDVYDESMGKLKADDKYVRYKISFNDGEIEESFEPSFGFDDDDNLLLRIDKEIPKGAKYRLSLIEEASSEDDVDTEHKVVEKEYNTSSIVQKETKGTTFFGALWGILTKGLGEAGRILVETFCNILIPIGDSFLDMICNAMGELVTIDGIVYNRVSKVDINFFDKADNSETSLRTPLKSVMRSAVDKVYVFFRNIVVVAFLAMLVFIGVKILYTSTASKKASYKSLFLAWVMGVMMLVFFPYVMKYSIKLNDALCKMVGDSDNTYTPEAVEGLAPLNGINYGTDEFVAHMLSSGDTVEDNVMLNVRYVGAKTWSIPLLIVYFIFIGQLCAILVMYYKRVFMIGFLIAIFPIVTLIYPLNKIGVVKANPFGIWFKEFMVNVFVQSFHAATYKVVVTLGIGAYQQSKNWLFMMICVLFLFEGEKILRTIFNARSGANTIGDMAMAGAFAMKMMKSAGSAIPSINKKNEESDDELSAKEKANKDLNRFSQSQVASSNIQAATGAAATGGVIAGALSSGGTSTSTTPATTNMTVTDIATSSATSNSNIKTTGTNMIDNNINKEKKKQKNSNAKIASDIGGTVFNIGAQVTGGIIGTTYGMAQTNAKSGLDSAVSGFVSGVATGKAVGEGGKGILTGIVDRSNTKKAARVVAKEYEDGKYDDQIGITEADRQLRSEKADAIRKAYANYARNSVKLRGKSAAQLAFYRDRMKIVNEHVDRDSH